MEHVAMLDLARNAAANVMAQWQGVDIDWANVRVELDSHLGNELANLDADWTGSDENNYRNLVARELERLHAS